jgi:hypothetical protein
VITLAHLKQITPSLLALAQVYLNNPGMSLVQLAYTPQAAAVAAVAQGILSQIGVTVANPNGLWNLGTLNLWANYFLYSQNATVLQNQLRGILTALYGQLTAPPFPGTSGTPGTPGFPGTPDEYIVTAVNVLAIVQELRDLRVSEDWEDIVEFGPRRVDRLLSHLGASKTGVFMYMRRDGRYRPFIQTTFRKDGKREAWNLSEEGFSVNDQTSGSGLFWQGEHDVTLVYVPIEMSRKKVTVPDLIASDGYAWMKRAAHGNMDLLDRASSFSTGMIEANVEIGDDDTFQVRAVAGTTPFSALGGAVGEVKYGTGIFEGRIAAGIFAESTYSGHENLIGYAETENTIRTPYAVVQQDDGPELKAWASTTVAAAGTLHHALSEQKEFDELMPVRMVAKQGDLRVIPEVHASLDTDYAKLSFYGGMTFALVPGGRIELDKVHRSLSLYPIRHHIGGAVSLKLTKIYGSFQEEASDRDRGIEEWWSDKEKIERRKQLEVPDIDEWLFLTLEGVGEVSGLYQKARVGLSLEVVNYSVGFLVEFENYLPEDFLDVRLGGTVSYDGFYIRGLSSIKDDDYRLEFGFEIPL